MSKTIRNKQSSTTKELAKRVTQMRRALDQEQKLRHRELDNQVDLLVTMANRLGRISEAMEEVVMTTNQLALSPPADPAKAAYLYRCVTEDIRSWRAMLHSVIMRLQPPETKTEVGELGSLVQERTLVVKSTKALQRQFLGDFGARR